MQCFSYPPWKVSDFSVELAVAAGEFAQTIAELSTSDAGLGAQLAGALSGLAAVERKAQELQDKQSTEDTLTIMATGACSRAFPMKSV